MELQLTNNQVVTTQDHHIHQVIRLHQVQVVHLQVVQHHLITRHQVHQAPHNRQIQVG